MSCSCEYCVHPSKNEKSINLPVPICFRYANTISVAVLNKFDCNSEEIIFVDEFQNEVIKRKFKQATAYVYDKLNQEIPNEQKKIIDRNGAESNWYVNVDGQNLSLKTLRTKSFGRNAKAWRSKISADNLVCKHSARSSADNLVYKNSETSDIVSSKLKSPRCGAFPLQRCPKGKKIKRRQTGKSVIENEHVEVTAQLEEVLSETTIKCKKTKKEVLVSAKDFIVEDEDEDDFIWTPFDSLWSAENLQRYISMYPEKAPLILNIVSEHIPNSFRKGSCNPIYLCIFQHPETKDEKEIFLSSTAIRLVPQYHEALIKFRNNMCDCMCD